MPCASIYPARPSRITLDALVMPTSPERKSASPHSAAAVQSVKLSSLGEMCEIV